MSARQTITTEQIELVKKLLEEGESIRSAAKKSKMAYCSAWRIANNFHKMGRRIVKKEPVRTGYFEHNPYYIF